ncbi:MAG TPA: pyridoxamine 5'-phosphate oxidase [Gaiellaceae bacterium]|nr:pyridoxamine 5'-phosphate oxidase [Gaiellaceae bacterium]
MSLGRGDLDPDPLRQFERWHAEAGGLDAVALATANEHGAPSVRMVLLKGADERGFVFHSSYEGRKARELAQNPRGALLFYWQEPGRQVRVEGEVERVDTAESEAYFRTRPRGGQLAAWASTQSEPIGSRAELEARFREVEAEYEGREVPLPPHWGGFRLVPEAYEFWEHRDNRLHDRFRYHREHANWVIERLSP